MVTGIVRKQTDENTASTRRTYLSATGTALGVTALASGTVAAGESKEQDDDDDPEVLNASDGEPIVIDQPGSYALADDIEVEEDETGVLIIADDVSLNGNGNTISGDGGGRGVFVNDDVQSADNAHIENIKLKDLEVGIRLFEPIGTRIKDVVVKDCEIGFIQDNDTTVTLLLDSKFDNSRVSVDETSEIFIIRCSIKNSDEDGLTIVDTTESLFIDNHIFDNDGSGVRTDGLIDSAFVGNDISDNDKSGVEFERSSDNKVINNSITDNGDAGIELDEDSEDNLIFGNNLSDNNRGPCDIAEPTENRIRENDPSCQ